MRVEFTVPGVPVGKQRPRVTRMRTYTPQKTVDYERKIRECWRTQSGESFPDYTPIFATMRAYFPIPRSDSKRQKMLKEGTYHVKRPDTDNIVKSVLDALNEAAFKDDSVVQIARAEKFQTNGAPRLEVVLEDAESLSQEGSADPGGCAPSV